MSETLVVTLEIAARPETVFGFFTDPTAFATWMGGGLGTAALEPRPGGALRVEFPNETVVRGEVVAIEPPGRFAFTWGYEGDESLPPGASTVEIVLDPVAGGTRLTLRHSGLPDGATRDAHRGGFRLYLSRLAAESALAQHAASVPGRTAAWFAAWNAEDPGERDAALEECLAERGEFRHPWAAVRGRADLAGHIASSRSVMGGVRLEPRGEPEICHRWVRFGWRAVRDGETVATGENVASLDSESRFELVIGFTDPTEHEGSGGG